MLHRTEDAARNGSARLERTERRAPTHRPMLERRRTNRLVSAWKAARGDLPFPSFAGLESATDPELRRHFLLMRVGSKGALTIERFGPPAPQAEACAATVEGESAPVVTPVVVAWVLSVGASVLRRRAPVSESDEVDIGHRRLCYRCAVVPVSSGGDKLDGLVAVLGYRWGQARSHAE
jgi:hypothetical protein